jgi:citrate synthase
LKDKFSEIVPKEQARVKKLKTEHGDLPLGQVTLSMVSAAARQDDLATCFEFNDFSFCQAYGGMRGIKGLVTETSLLDPEEVCPFLSSIAPHLARFS